MFDQFPFSHDDHDDAQIKREKKREREMTHERVEARFKTFGVPFFFALFVCGKGGKVCLENGGNDINTTRGLARHKVDIVLDVFASLCITERSEKRTINREINREIETLCRGP